MKRELAENLLAQIMGWNAAEKARETARLEILAAYKYDNYQQFAPGRRFIESLALWLRQFPKPQERSCAYQFVCEQLIFISDEEMNHLVDLAFPTSVRPKLFSDAAKEANITPVYRVKQIASSIEYRCRLRQTLVLGLSDGARTDRFRRANPQSISHEQVFHAYDMSRHKADGMKNELKKDLATILNRDATDTEAAFRYVVLLDDFTASGTSYIRRNEKDEQWEGKISRIIAELDKSQGLGGCIADSGVHVLVVIYIAADQAIKHITDQLAKLPFNKGSIELDVVFRLSESHRVNLDSQSEFSKLIKNKNYFDTRADDEAGKVGGTSKQFGYADGRLPLILNHNTPNNSIYLLWAEEEHDVLGLFPRVSRHRAFE